MPPLTVRCMFQMRAQRDAMLIKKISARKTMLIIALSYGQSWNFQFCACVCSWILTTIQVMPWLSTWFSQCQQASTNAVCRLCQQTALVAAVNSVNFKLSSKSMKWSGLNLWLSQSQKMILILLSQKCQNPKVNIAKEGPCVVFEGNCLHLEMVHVILL